MSVVQRSYEIRVNTDTCEGCGVCIAACPVNYEILRRDKFLDETNCLLIVENGVAVHYRDELCQGCGVCIENCPVNAIHIIMRKPLVVR